MPLVERRVDLDVPADVAFAWHERPGALERLTPPWERARVIARSGEGVRDGVRVEVEMRAGPLPVRFLVEHRSYRAGERFVDVQVAGPFASWQHVHEVSPRAGGGCTWRDAITFEVPWAAAGRAFAAGAIARRLDRALAWRHATLRDDLALHAALPPGGRRIAVTGASGFIGSTLVPLLRTGGHEVLALNRGRGDARLRWDPRHGLADPAALEGLDALIHLAGEGIADARWTDERKRVLVASRVEGTRSLVGSLRAMRKPPSVLASASAVGIYPSSSDEVDESAAPGSGFLATLCRDWEAAAHEADSAGVRVTTPRFGLVLSPAGGALAKMLPPFRLGAGGPMGSGRQWQSWITIDDTAAALATLALGGGFRGPVNVVAPQPVPNEQLARTLARVLGRPCLLPAPAPLLRLALGEMADEALLASQRVRPAVLLGAGHVFRHPTLEHALQHVLGRTVTP